MKPKNTQDDKTNRRIRCQFGASLKAALAERGWKQVELARMLSRSPGAISLWIGGHSAPTLCHLVKLRSLLNLPELDSLRELGHVEAEK